MPGNNDGNKNREDGAPGLNPTRTIAGADARYKQTSFQNCISHSFHSLETDSMTGERKAMSLRPDSLSTLNAAFNQAGIVAMSQKQLSVCQASSAQLRRSPKPETARNICTRSIAPFLSAVGDKPAIRCGHCVSGEREGTVGQSVFHGVFLQAFLYRHPWNINSVGDFNRTTSSAPNQRHDRPHARHQAAAFLRNSGRPGSVKCKCSTVHGAQFLPLRQSTAGQNQL